MADVKNAKDGKFTEVKDQEVNQQEPKKEGKAKRILRGVAREAMFTIVGAAAVGAVWGYTSKKGSKADNGSEDEDKKSDGESEDKD